MKCTLAVVLLLCSTSAVAAEDKAKLVSVLPFDATRTKLDDSNKTALEESIRTEAGDTLGDFGLTVLTSDTQLKILTDNGIDPNKACEAACHLEAARELNARYFISGIVTSEGDGLVAFIRLFDSTTGRQLTSAQLEGKTVRELRKAFSAKAKAFFAKAGFGTAPAPAAPAGEPSVQRSAQAEEIARRSAAGHKDLSRHEGEAVEPPPPPATAQTPPEPGTLSLAPEQPLAPPPGVYIPVRATPQHWERWFVAVSVLSFFAIGKEWGSGHLSFRFGWLVLSGRWYQDPFGDGLYVEFGLPFGIGYQWHLAGGNKFAVGIPNLIEYSF